MESSPRNNSTWRQPWLWPLRKLSRFTHGVPPGLWLMNMFCQCVLDVNGEVPWMVHFTSRVVGRVSIGRNVWKSFALSGSCYIQGGNGISIGDETIFASGVKLISANHDQSNLAVWSEEEPLQIGNRCWIGANAVVLPGAHLGDDVVVGAGAVVTSPFPSGSVVGGVPARLLNHRPVT